MADVLSSKHLGCIVHALAVEYLWRTHMQPQQCSILGTLVTFFAFMFQYPGDQQGAKRHSTTHKKASLRLCLRADLTSKHIKKHSMTRQVDKIDFLHEKQSLRKPSHAFGSGLMKESETEKTC